jgi:hypothetical protein
VPKVLQKLGPKTDWISIYIYIQIIFAWIIEGYIGMNMEETPSGVIAVSVSGKIIQLNGGLSS